MIGLEEDRLSKPNRPIVSGRISLAEAQRLYLTAGVIALLYSTYHRLVLCSVIYMFSIYLYNEGGLSCNWFMKSLLGAIGYMCYSWGTTAIFDHGRPLSQTSTIAVALSGLLHVTTGHAQDFRDCDGDAAIGRKTLAILLPPRFARWSLMVLVFVWTGGLAYLWKPPSLVSILFAALGIISTVKFVMNYTREADRDSYWWYNMWLISAHLLPVFKRIADSRSTL